VSAVLFENVVGHQRIRELLGRALERGVLHTGYLLAGPEGVGKQLVAREFARAYLCLEEGAEPCGRCVSCRHGSAASHPDLLLLEPEEKKKSISIDQVRALGEFVGLSPSHGKRKLAIISPADAMTPPAANALLKTLEEPPPGRVIVLVTARPGSLPVTVLSRCQQLAFGALEDDDVAAVLRRQGWPERTARQAAALAEGSPGVALARDGKVWQEAADGVRRLLEALAGGDRCAGLAFAEGVRDGREGAQLSLQVLLGHIRRAARHRLGVGSGDAADLPPGVLGAGDEELVRTLERVLETYRLIEGNANPRLALASLFAGWGAEADA
jgi:DNA polymerase-3 subunit delta'